MALHTQVCPIGLRVMDHDNDLIDFTVFHPSFFSQATIRASSALDGCPAENVLVPSAKVEYTCTVVEEVGVGSCHSYHVLYSL